MWTQRAIAGTFGVGAHVAIILALMLARNDPPPPVLSEPISVAMMDMPPAPAPAAAAPAAKPKVVPTKPKPRVVRTRTLPLPKTVVPIPAEPEPAEVEVAELTDAQIAGAGTAGSGSGTGMGSGTGGGRACNMVQWLQAALRKDASVHAAVAEAHRAHGTSRALLVWNGEWIRSRGQEGNGLAGVREAIMLEVAFAPEACRADPVSGLVLISLNDGPGSGRLVLGSGRWRWSDLLKVKGGPS